MRPGPVELQNDIHLGSGGNTAHRAVIGEIPGDLHPPILRLTRPLHISQQATALNGKVSRNSKSLLRAIATAADTGVCVGLDCDAVHIGMAAAIHERHEVVRAVRSIERPDNNVGARGGNGAFVPVAGCTPQKSATGIRD